MSRAEQTGGRESAPPRAAQTAGAPSGPEAAAARALAEAADAGDAARVSSLLASGAFADSRLRGGETPLMRASARGYADVARVLLDAGADASAHRADGFTPLILAAFFGHEEIVRLLLERGADASARTGLGTTAEKWAASRCFDGVTSLLQGAAHKTAARASVSSVAPRAKTASDPLEDVGIFSRSTGGASEGLEVVRASDASRAEVDEGAAVKNEDGARVGAPVGVDKGSPSRANRGARASVLGLSAGDSFGEGERVEGGAGVSVIDEGSLPSHPSQSKFSFGAFARSWQASVGTTLLLLAGGALAYSFLRGGGARQNQQPAPQPAQPVAQQPAQAVAPAPAVSPTPLAPDAQAVVPAADPNAYPMAGNASQPYYDPPVINNIPPSSNIPRDLTVVSESGAPAPEDTPRARQKPTPTGAQSGAQQQPPPAREGEDSKPEAGSRADSERATRPPDAEPRPTPRTASPAPTSAPERGKVIPWPPQ